MYRAASRPRPEVEPLRAPSHCDNGVLMWVERPVSGAGPATADTGQVLERPVELVYVVLVNVGATLGPIVPLRRHAGGAKR